MKKFKRLSLRKKKKSEFDDVPETTKKDQSGSNTDKGSSNQSTKKKFFSNKKFYRSKSHPETSQHTIDQGSQTHILSETLSTIPKTVDDSSVDLTSHGVECPDDNLTKQDMGGNGHVNENALNNGILSNGSGVENTLLPTPQSPVFNFQPAADYNTFESSDTSNYEICDGDDKLSESQDKDENSLFTAHAMFQNTMIREFKRLAQQGWYWGPLTRTEAEEKLAKLTDGSFLVRDSSDERYLLSLSFRSFGRSLHTRIEHSNGKFSFYADGGSQSYTSVVDLIEDSVRNSQHSGIFCYSRPHLPLSPTLPVRLTSPVSRLSQVRTLQYLCRFVIRQYTRIDHIQELPLPDLMKGYVNQSYF